jgi:glycosyltransferase 2 family protein
MRKWILALLGIVVSTAALALIVSKTEWRETASRLADTGFRTPALLVLIYICTFPVRAFRWYWILPPGTLTFTQSLKGVILGFAGNNVLPARGGEFLRMEYLYRTAPHIGRLTALSSILIIRILDGLTLLGILVVSLAASSIAIAEYPWLVDLRALAMLVFGLACAGSILLRFGGVYIAAWLHHFDSKLFHWAARMIERFHVATEFIGANPPTMVAVVASIAVWLIEGSMFVVACWHFGLGSHSIVAGYLTLAIVNFGLLVPSGPAYVGVFQGMTILALRLFGMSDDTAFALSLVIHACQFIPLTLSGLAVFYRESMRLGYRPSSRAPEADAARTSPS